MSAPPSHLADLDECGFDLLQASQYFKHALETYPSIAPPKTERDIFAWSAFLEAGIVRYARSFGSGRRYRLDSVFLSELDEAELELHHRLLTIRSKHVAHAVNMFQNTVLSLQIKEHGTERAEVTSVSTQGHSTAPLSGAELKLAIQIIEKIRSRLRQAMDEEKLRLLVIANNLSRSALNDMKVCNADISEDPDKLRPAAKT